MTGWISPFEPERAPAGRRPTHLLRTRLSGVEGRATLRITAHGVYEAHLNGSRVGDHELTPGYTEYTKRLQVQEFEVELAAGENELVIELSDGWYRGQVGLFRSFDQWGKRTALWAELVADGVTLAATGPEWQSAQTSHLADMIEGETVDLRECEYAWHPVEVVDGGDAELVTSDAPPVRRIEELVPVSVTARGDDWIVDLGQNITGWLRLTGLGARDSVLTLTYGEELGPNGDVTQVNIVPDVPFLAHPLSAGQVDRVISDGEPRSVFEPRHSTKGFRYVRIEGLAHEPDAVGIVVHTDLRRTGTFECSNDSLNLLHNAAVWSFRGNVVDIPTDCPTRERAGWTGDWQIYMPTAAYLYDVAGFSTKWLKDLSAAQWENGVVPNMAPAPYSEVREGPAAGANGSAGWGDAAIIVPWEQYMAYGDTAVLENNWPMMVRWIDFVRAAAEGSRHPDRVARGFEPLPHERYLWDTGFHWGEWLEPMRAGESVDFPALLRADKGDVATAFYRRSTELLARIATALGKHAEAAEYIELSDHVRRAWQAEFVRPDATVFPNTQATCVRALAFDLVDNRTAVADQLVRLVRAAGTHLTTGFLATPDLLPMLAENGHPDVAFELLLQRTWPSWLGMIDAGATTIWERWEGWTADGQPHESHNHFSKGAVIGFLHRNVAGIRPLAPGYSRFALSPIVSGGLTSARAELDTMHGRIEASWTLDGDVFVLDTVVPDGTTCVATLPDGSTHDLTTGRHTLRSTI
jgi:alpha-L-rhamnosidase